MKKSLTRSILFTLLTTLLVLSCDKISDNKMPWNNGCLTVSENGRYLMHENGTPFFWLGDTGWLLPEKLSREECAIYLDKCQKAGFNVIQVQTVNNVPAVNYYEKLSHPNGYDFSDIDSDKDDGYWGHMDYIINQAAKRGIYIGMVCIWGDLVNAGKMSCEQAVEYGRFLAERYKDKPNIIWIIGGDTRGDSDNEIWNTLAETIKRHDPNHIMSYHPRGRTISATWFHDCEWLDFNMFQSGHRSYDQLRGDADDNIAPVAEDNWRYVETAMAYTPAKPVIDAEPSYEDIPHGLHDADAPRWQAKDVRRYAYWSVFAGSCGHTYGHNSIMQMLKPEDKNSAYFAEKYWYDALNDAGFNQMKHLKNLMLAFPYFDRVPAQEALVGNNGIRYKRLAATCGNDYLLVYDYTADKITADLNHISGKSKKAWWYSTIDGTLKYAGTYPSRVTEFTPETEDDVVLILIDSSADYIKKRQAYFE